MHEWLSLALLVPFVLHLWKNWRPMTGYLRSTPMAVALALWRSPWPCRSSPPCPSPGPRSRPGEPGGPPQFALAHEVLTHSPVEIAPVLGTTPDDLVARLEAGGFIVTDPGQALTEIAATSGRTEAELAQALLPAAS